MTDHDAASDQRSADGTSIEIGSFTDFYRSNAPRMVRLAFLLTAGSSVAEDLVQDVFIRVQPRWDTIEHPNSYVRTAVVRAAASHQRRRALERRLRWPPRDEAMQAAVDELTDAVAQLPIRQRTAVVLRFYADLPEREIAAAMGCRLPAVKSLLHRALAALREEVDR